MSLELLKNRIKDLDKVCQEAFGGTDYTFGFNTWKSGTIVVFKKCFSKEKDIIEQIESIRLNRVDVHRTDAKAYNLEACKNEARTILETFILVAESKGQRNNEQSFWELLHPKVVELAKERFENGFLADAVVTCLKEANSIIKNYVKAKTGQELDGAALMTKAFSVNNPVIVLADLSNENGKNIQQGYMKLFEGAMIGIRNPKSHENMYPNERTTIHLLFNASFIFVKLEESGILS